MPFQAAKNLIPRVSSLSGPCQSLLPAFSRGPQRTSKGDAEDFSLKAKAEGKAPRWKAHRNGRKRERKRKRSFEVEGARSSFILRWEKRGQPTRCSRPLLARPLNCSSLALFLFFSFTLPETIEARLSLSSAQA